MARVKRARKYAGRRRFLTAAVIALAAITAAVVGGSTVVHTAAASTGDTSCGYGTTQFSESTVMRWAQVNGFGSSAKFVAYANDENSTLLGVNTATAMVGTSSPQHAGPASGGDASQNDGIPLTAGTLSGSSTEKPRPYFPALYITPVSSAGGWTKPGDALPPALGDWQQGASPQNINGSGPFVDDVFGTWVVASQNVSPSAAAGQVATLNQTLTVNVTYGTTTIPYSLQVTALSAPITSGDSIKIAEGANSQTLTAAAAASQGDTVIKVKTFKAGKSYTTAATVSDLTAHTGDYARQATLPTKNNWTLGTGSDAPVGTTFANMGNNEGYGTEFRWNVNELTDYQGAALQAGKLYKVQIIEHDGDQNNGLGGDSGEFCTLLSLPGVSTAATGGDLQTDGTATISDKVTVSGLAPIPSGTTGKITVKAFGPQDASCTGTPAGSNDIPLTSGNPNGDYTQNFTVFHAGDYRFTADVFVGNTKVASSACNAAGEKATIAPRPTSLTTEAGGPYFAPITSLTDVATLSGGTTDATGTLTFTLRADDGSGGCGATIGTATVNVTSTADANGHKGADGKLYSSGAVSPAGGGNLTPGQYHWSVSYSGDSEPGTSPAIARNGSSSDGVSPCPAVDSDGPTPPSNHENPMILRPHIAIDKSPDTQTIEAAGNGELTPPAGTTPGTATFNVTVTNDGNVDLTAVQVTDALAADCNRNGASAIGALAIGASFGPYSCTKTGLDAGLHNTASTSGQGGGRTVTASDTADVKVIKPQIEVTKQIACPGGVACVPPVRSISIAADGTVTFLITVTNTSTASGTAADPVTAADTDLTNVTITDAQAPNCATKPGDANYPAGLALMHKDAVVTYTCSLHPVTFDANGLYTNAVGGCGTDELGGKVCDNDGTQGTPSTDCTTAGGNSADQCVTVSKNGIKSTQDFRPKDTAHVSGLVNTPNGTLTFSLYKGACTAANQLDLDSANATTKNLTASVNANGDYPVLATDFLSSMVQAQFGANEDTAGTYNWKITYTGDTNGNADNTSDEGCGVEHFSVDNG